MESFLLFDVMLDFRVLDLSGLEGTFLLEHFHREKKKKEKKNGKILHLIVSFSFQLSGYENGRESKRVKNYKKKKKIAFYVSIRTTYFL